MRGCIAAAQIDPSYSPCGANVHLAPSQYFVSWAKFLAHAASWIYEVAASGTSIDREEESRKRLRQLQKQIVEVKRSRETELQQRSEMIAHLKDQLQEVKAKTAMEGKYVKKVCDVSVAQTQKRCLMSEKALQNEIEVWDF